MTVKAKPQEPTSSGQSHTFRLMPDRQKVCSCGCWSFPKGYGRRAELRAFRDHIDEVSGKTSRPIDPRVLELQWRLREKRSEVRSLELELEDVVRELATTTAWVTS